MTTAPPPVSAATQANGVAVSGFVVSLAAAILGLRSALLFCLLPLVPGITCLALSGVGLARARQTSRSGNRLAITGVVLDVMAVVMSVVVARGLDDVANSPG